MENIYHEGIGTVNVAVHRMCSILTQRKPPPSPISYEIGLRRGFHSYKATVTIAAVAMVVTRQRWPIMADLGGGGELLLADSLSEQHALIS